ncbi:hypothetical protein A2V49_03410 [candidate division WWE3 bacterium RBG_19FT_COMBO_34_6]|uniref:Spore coat protein U domain-containing protein n=1 Tax=candidate division WWE3 bacterium RBG_19FT_COMBO_34_6 TaxID=1802612 RepID=A0A1F4UKI9_UNCKA|nr:MAG: hypothetical protein A2V49_03410 [candidate division WWE3 bacterium RBG_19FT_COMBO_34_6]
MDVTVNTNAYSGYQVYISDTGNGVNGGLFHSGGNLILSADMVLSPGVAGYGAQASSPSAIVDPKYNYSGNTVGAVNISDNQLFSNLLAATNEAATVIFKAAMSPTTTAGDYSDIIYFTVTPNL